MRNAAKLIAAVGLTVGALTVLTSIHTTVVDAGADVVLVGSLLAFAQAVFRFIDEG